MGYHRILIALANPPRSQNTTLGIRSHVSRANPHELRRLCRELFGIEICSLL